MSGPGVAHVHVDVRRDRLVSTHAAAVKTKVYKTRPMHLSFRIRTCATPCFPRSSQSGRTV